MYAIVVISVRTLFMATFDSEKDFKKAQKDLLELADEFGVELTKEEQEAISKLPEGKNCYCKSTNH